MQEVPNFSWDVPRALARAALFKNDLEKLTLPLNSYFEQTANQEREFTAAATSNVIVLNPVKFLSKGGIIPSSENGFPIYQDVHHLTLHGTILIRAYVFANVFVQPATRHRIRKDNSRSDFLIVAVVPALLATPSAALGDLASSASVAARPTRGDRIVQQQEALCLELGARRDLAYCYWQWGPSCARTA
jgi:hypothetical protein